MSDGRHESLVAEALDGLPGDLVERFWAEFIAWLQDLSAIVAEGGRGVPVPPDCLRPAHEQMREEADRRSRLGDPTWIAWDAWAESTRLKRECRPFDSATW